MSVFGRFSSPPYLKVDTVHPLECVGMWKQVFCNLRASRASRTVFNPYRAGAGLPVCVVREALWAQQGDCGRMPASLSRIIAAVPDPVRLQKIGILFVRRIKTTQHCCIQEKKKINKCGQT